MCPNKSSPEYKKLVEDLKPKYGKEADEYAHLAWIRHGEKNEIPNIEQANKYLSDSNSKGWNTIDNVLENHEHGELGKQLKDLINEKGRTAKDALNIIANNEGVYKKLAAAILNLNPKNLDAELFKKSPQDSVNRTSTYYIKDHKIGINGLLNDDPRHYMHEITHAITSREIQTQIGDVIGKNPKEIHYDKSEIDKVLKSDKVTQPVKDLLSLFIKVRDEFPKSGDYGFTNVDEFIAEAFSNVEFQEKLNSVKGLGGKTLWDNFVEAIKSMLGFSSKSGSALEETLRNALEVSKQERSDAYRKYFEDRNSPETEKFAEDEFTRHLGEEDFKTTEDFFNRLPDDEKKYIDSQYNGDALEFAKNHFENHGEEGPNLLSANKSIKGDEIPLTGNSSDSGKIRKQVTDNIKELQRKSIEQPLVNKEVPIQKLFKKTKYNFLNDQDLSNFNALLDNFVNSRSRTSDPTENRVSVVDLENKLQDLKDKGDQGAFDYLASEYPEGFANKTFDDFGNNIDVVNQYVQQILNSSEFEGEAAKTPQARLDTEDVIRNIQQSIKDNNRIDDLRNTLHEYLNPHEALADIIKNSPEIKASLAETPELQKSVDNFSQVLKEHGVDSGKIINQIYDYGINTDPSELPTFADVRKLKYLLQAMDTDGYFPFVNTFISNEIREVLKTKGINFNDGYGKKNPFTNNIESVVAMRNRIEGSKEATHFITAMGAPLHDSYNRAQRAHFDFLIPFTETVNKKWVEKNGKKFNSKENNQMGMMAMLRQRYIDETPNEALRKNLDWLEKSAANHQNSNVEAEKNAAIDQRKFITELTKGIDLESQDDQRNLLESNFSKLVSPEALGYIKDQQQIFELTKPIAKMASEFGYGKEFNEIENYFPSFTLPTGGSFEENKGVLYNGDIDISTPVENFMIGSKGAANINASRNGMSSIKLRERVIPEGRRLIYNINNMIVNRGRLNLLDGFTALRRKEMANVLKSRDLSYFLGDYHRSGDKVYFDQRGRTNLLRKSYNQEWTNMIQANSYLGTFQQVLNGLTRRFSVAKLASLYRAPVHILGNFTSYLVANPGRSFDLMKSYAAMAEAHRNPEYRNLLDKLFFESRKRSQDVTLDRSTNINIGLEGETLYSRIAEGIKESKVFQGIAKVDDIVQKALFAPLKWSDQSSGNAIMLTEFLHNERERTNNPQLDFKDLVLNDKNTISYHKALNEMERHVSIGDASRRGLWLNNTNPSISLLRNLTVAFAGKKIMNATNFTVALHNYMSGTMTRADKINTIRFMGAIAAQTATFQLVKWSLQGFTGNAILQNQKQNKDDSLEQLYKKQLQDQSLSPRQKAQLEQEISTRRHIRSAFQNSDSHNWDGKMLAVDILKDTLPNMFVATSLLPSQTDGIIHMFWDTHEQASFQQMKQAELDRLRTVREQAKENGNASLFANASQKMSDLESQKAQLVINKHENFQDFGGIIGEFLNENYKFGQQAVGSVVGTQEITPSDIVNILSAYGAGTPEIQQFFRLHKQITDPVDKSQQQLQQKYQKLQKEGKNY